jgi:hypothetical protein
MARVDQRGMLGLGLRDELAGRGGALAVERNRDDYEILVLQFRVERLPPGQVKAATSP